MTPTTRSYFIAVIAILTAASAFGAGRTQNYYAGMNTQQMAEKNYVQALQSGNDGAKISAAGFLADYQMTGAVPALIQVLKFDKAENVRISAALALVMLDEQSGRAAVEESSLYDGSDRVAQFCEALLKVHAQKGAAFAAE
jgi:hypothetical protein